MNKGDFRKDRKDRELNLGTKTRVSVFRSIYGRVDWVPIDCVEKKSQQFIK